MSEPETVQCRVKFSLRTLLLLSVLAALAIGWPIHKVRQQGIVLAALEQLGCSEQYVASERPLTGIERLRKLCGQTPIYNVSGLDASRSQLTDAALIHIKALVGLNSLNLHGTRVTDAGLAQLEELTQLRALVLSETQITDGGLVHLRRLTGLTVLCLDGRQVTATGMDHLLNLAQLRTLDLSGTHVQLMDLGDGRSIYAVDRKLTQHTDDDVSPFGSQERPTRLADGSAWMTDAKLVHLECLHQLTNVNLSETQITDAGLGHLQGLTQLEALSLRNAQITDAGLAHVEALTQLKFLDLVGTAVTDAGLVHLLGLSRLSCLLLEETQVTSAGYEELMRQFPNLDFGADE